MTDRQTDIATQRLNLPSGPKKLKPKTSRKKYIQSE